MVHGAEHFFTQFGSLTCTAAPVDHADGMEPVYWMHHPTVDRDSSTRARLFPWLRHRSRTVCSGNVTELTC